MDWSDERLTNLLMVAAVQTAGLLARLRWKPARQSSPEQEIERLVRRLPAGSRIEHVRPDGSTTRVFLPPVPPRPEHDGEQQ